MRVLHLVKDKAFHKDRSPRQERFKRQDENLTPMRINGISRSKSSDGCVALSISPAITGDSASRFLTRYEETPETLGTKAEFCEGLLLIKIPYAKELHQDLRTLIDVLLEEQAQLVEAGEPYAPEAESPTTAGEQVFINEAARRLNLPIV
jgi:hypothetical protein